MSVALEMKRRYNAHIATATEAQQRGETLTSGQMLLLAFDSLFNNLDTTVRDLRAATRASPVPAQWAGLRQIAASGAWVTRVLGDDDATTALVDLSVFLCRLVLLRDFFTLCTTAMLSFKAEPRVLGEMLPSGDDMARALTQFVSEYYRRQLVGFATLNLSVFVASCVGSPEDFEEAFVDVEGLAEVLQTRARMGHTDGLNYEREVTHLEAALRRLEMAKYLEQNVEVVQANQQVNQLQHASFQWFHETDLASAADGGVTFVAPVRPTLLAELKTSVANMSAMQENAAETQARYRELHVAVEQRLKWACGANPEVQDMFDGFSTAFVGQLQSLKTVSAVMRSVSGTVSAVLHHEALRTPTAEAVAADSAFMALMGECQQSAELKEAQSQTLSADELRLFSMSPLASATDIIDAEWIRQTEGVISKQVAEIRGDMKAEGERLRGCSVDLKDSGDELRRCISAHQKLMTDVGALMRSISKSEDYDIPEIATYLTAYKSFSESVSHVVGATAAADEQTDDSVKAIGAAADRAKDLVGQIYGDVIKFGDLLREDNVEVYRVKKGAEEPTEEETDKRRQQHQNIGVEEKNEFAMTALRRVRLKLEGREPDALRRSSVAEQVDFIIREATCLDNLALLYEGWTAWI